MKNVFHALPILMLITLLHGDPQVAHAQTTYGSWTTKITSPADNDIITPDPNTGYITVSGTVEWSGVFGFQPPNLRVKIIEDSTGLPISSDFINTNIVKIPGQNKANWSNTVIGPVRNKGLYTIEAQALDGNLNPLGNKASITVKY